MSQIWEYIKIALMNIRSNKGRSVLTMLGIIIGISSVIMIMSIGNGVKQTVNSELNDIGGGQIYIYTEGRTKDGDSVAFTMADAELIRDKVPHVKGITPTIYLNATANSRKGNVNAQLQLGTDSLQYRSSDPIVKGRYFSQKDCDAGNKVCVLREKDARTLFGSTDVIGMPIEVDVYGAVMELVVIGIRQDNAASLLSAEMSMAGDGEVSIEAPVSLLEKVFGFEWTYNDFLIICDGAEYSKQVARSAVKLLENKLDVRGKDAIQIQNFDDIMGQMTKIINVVTLFIALVAAISLLVGGIGVMNIMLVSVTERTREIGIRKALGARTGSILLQFLSESAIITMLGGIIGILLGLLGGVGICALMKITPHITMVTVLGTTLFSMGVGVFFGIYPARKAAKLSPIEALRHE